MSRSHLVCTIFFLNLLFSNLAFAQNADSVVLRNQHLRFSAAQVIAPAALVTAGLLSSGEIRYNVARWRNDQLPDFKTSLDDGLALSPIIFIYGLDLVGIRARNDFMNRSAILAKSELMMLGTVYLLKYTTKELRPDGTDRESFPSGHTAQAFLGAAMLSVEYKDELPWMPYAAYTVAASVGALRIANNKHYLSDVLVGAGIGILSQKVSYWTHRYRWGRNVDRPIFKF